MNLDCVEGSDLRDAGDAWVIIDHDNDGREFACGHSVDNAWYLAALRLEKRVNDARLILEA